MKSDRPNRTSRHAAVARGRMFLRAKMAWLPGYPLGTDAGAVRWASLPRRGETAAERFRLGRSELQDATFTWSKLVHRFPRALPYVVEDVARWRVGVPELLELLKGAIHHGRDLPASLFGTSGAYGHATAERAERLGGRRPALRPLIDALSWCLALTPDDAPDALRWLDGHATPLTALLGRVPGADGVELVLTLWELARRDGAHRAAPLLMLLADERTHDTTMRDAAPLLEGWEAALQRARDRVRSRPPAPPPADPLIRSLLPFVRRLPTRNRGERRRSYALLALLLPPPHAGRWHGWWRRTEPLLARARRLVAAPPTSERIAESERLQADLAALRAAQPPPFHAETLLEHVATLTNPERARFCDEAIATLRALPPTPTIATHATPAGPAEVAEVRAALLHRWLVDAAWSRADVVAWLPELRRYLEGSGDDALLPWSTVVAVWRSDEPPRYFWDLEQHLRYRVARAAWPTALSALTLALDRDGGPALAPPDADPIALRDATLALLDLAGVGGDAEQALHRFDALRTAGQQLAHYLPDGLLACAHQLDRDDGRFAALVAILAAAPARDGRLYEGLRALDDAVSSAGRPGLVRALIDDGALGELQTLARRLIGLKALVGATPVPDPVDRPDDPAWRERYPAALHPALDALADATLDAERIADDLLGRTFPTVAALERERDALTRKLRDEPDDSGLARRLATVTARLDDHPPTVPEGRTRRLGHKLARRARREELRRWSRRFERDLRAALAQRLGVAEVDDALLDPRPLAILAALLELPRSTRELGLELLRRRCGPPPWLPHDDPANRAFAGRLEAQGIDLAPWLAPNRTPFEVGGRTLTLALEDDPLEILDMGGHFDTCLAPGAFNFFSAVVNAADLNKRVVYARDERGRVLGRCLLALGDRGELIAFEPYAHDRSLGFGDRVGELVETLAERMGTGVALRARIPPLLAPDWYDDGPVDLSGRFAFLEEGSAFRRALVDLDPDALPELLAERFAPLTLNALTLPLILELPELEARPELAVPLLPTLGDGEGVPHGTVLLAATLAQRAGATAFVERALRRRIFPHLLAQGADGYLDDDGVALLIAHLPSLALQLLRRTRATGVTRDEEEPWPHRRAWLADAHEALGRSERASRLRGSD